MAKANMNGLRLIRCIPLLSKIENFCENVVCIQSYIIQKNFGVQKYHKSLLFKAKNFFAK
jgi:hypothetical protein